MADFVKVGGGGRLPSGIARAQDGQRDNRVPTHRGFFRMEKCERFEPPRPGSAEAVGFILRLSRNRRNRHLNLVHP